jgi:hypothetical protein
MSFVPSLLFFPLLSAVVSEWRLRRRARVLCLVVLETIRQWGPNLGALELSRVMQRGGVVVDVAVLGCALKILLERGSIVQTDEGGGSVFSGAFSVSSSSQRIGAPLGHDE